MRVTILGIRHGRIRNFGERPIRPEFPRGRPVPVRFDVQLLKATRLENGDREVKALLANLEPAEALRSDA